MSFFLYNNSFLTFKEVNSYQMINFTPLTFICFLIVFTCASCHKTDADPSGNYTCTCSYVINTQSYTTKTSLPKERKSIAQQQCDTTQNVYTIGGASNVNCSFN